MEKITVIIADDKARYRDLISDMLEPSRVSVIAEAENGKQLLNLLCKKQPDIVLLDLEMPVMDGNKTFDVVSKDFPDVKVVILSFYFEQVLVDDYLKRGAKGYISKDVLEPELLMEALTEIQNGGIYLQEKLTRKKIFTERQKEIMPFIFEGMTNKEIADEIYITERAIEKQRQKIYQRSGAKKAVDFYKYAFTRGLQFLGVVKQSKDANP
ncbi:MAG: response regulator transcription factor [Bacteroidota bacterium]